MKVTRLPGRNPASNAVSKTTTSRGDVATPQATRSSQRRSTHCGTFNKLGNT